MLVDVACFQFFILRCWEPTNILNIFYICHGFQKSYVHLLWSMGDHFVTRLTHSLSMLHLVWIMEFSALRGVLADNAQTLFLTGHMTGILSSYVLWIVSVKILKKYTSESLLILFLILKFGKLHCNSMSCCSFLFDFSGFCPICCDFMCENVGSSAQPLQLSLTFCTFSIFALGVLHFFIVHCFELASRSWH